jgi:cytochrome c oxidase subunit II
MLHSPELASVPVLAGAGFMPERASSVAAGVDGVFSFIFWVSAFFLVLIVAVTVLFVARYRARPSRPEPEASPDHDTRLELLWTGIPLVLAMVIFAASTRVYLAMSSSQPGASPLRVQVTGRKWSWWFDHAGGKGAKELHLVAGRPAELVLASTDVIHSLYVPEFRLKQDAVPGRYTRMVFTPTLPGSYPVLCAEYCGTNHSRMNAVAVVHPDQASFDAWSREGVEPEATLVDLGRRVFTEKGCVACHSVDGTPGVGPTVRGLWGKTEKLQSGATAAVDENYVRESILAPGAKLTAGYDDVMPPIPLEEREIQGVIAYLQSLKEAP